jgi:predicted neutral ceramidase superfamily lipid hydrolase
MMRYPFIFILASALFFAVLLGVINEFFKISFISLFLPLILGIQTYAKYGAVKKYGIYVILISLICLWTPDIIKIFLKIYSGYTAGKTNWTWDITDLISFLPYLFCSLTLGFLLSQGFLIKKIFNTAS